MLTLFLLFGIFVSEVHCGYYFVTAPNVLRYDQDGTVLVSVFGLTNAYIKIWLEHGYKRFSEKIVTVKDEKTPVYTFVKVTENDIMSTVAEEKVRKIQLCAEWNGVKQTREILLNYHSGYLITQTSKPIYTPTEKVKIRTLALDESLKAVDGWQVGIDIVSPSNKTFGRKLFLNSPSGFYQNDFTLPPNPEIGIWSTRAFYKGQFETESRALFEVREYVLPTFEVTIDVDVDYILPHSSLLIVTVKSKYVYGKPVHGNARLTLILKGEDRDFILDIAKRELEVSPAIERSVSEFSIPIEDIFNSPLLGDNPFPDRKRLEVIASVYESATGNEVVASNDETIFTTNPFLFKFTKSKLNFRPGFEYHLKVEVLYVNGKPAKNIDVHVQLHEDDVFRDEIAADSTNEDGLITLICPTSSETNKLSFKVYTSNNEFQSDIFEVTAYEGKNQINVEHMITGRNMLLMRAFTNINGNFYTGMLFMIISRGKIIYTKYKDPSNSASVKIPKELQDIVTPDARLLVFYVDQNTHEIVADSVKFEVEKKCRGDGLHMETSEKEVEPRSHQKLTLTGTPYMFVGLNIIDKALLNDKTVLGKDKMFETLQSHDLGCGEGSGRSGAEVFKKSGLTVLTNAFVEDDDLDRKTDGCKRFTRKRRDLDKKSEYLEDMEKLADFGIFSILRYDLRESWLFDVYQLDKDGHAEIQLYLPESITEWRIHAIGITKDKGICIADQVDFKTFRDFFIQLDIPYKVARLKYFSVKATLFNYGTPGDADKTAKVYLKGVENICYNSKPGKPSPGVQVKLPPNSAKTVSFPVIPLKEGLFPVTVSTIVTNSEMMKADEIEKRLNVVNEVLEEKLIIIVCLDPLTQNQDCVNDIRVVSDIQATYDERHYEIDLTLPENSISQTGAATAYIQSNIMTNIVNSIIAGVESLFQKPAGMGESNMIRLAPTVYALGYLKQTKQMTDDIETKGNQWVRDGVIWEINGYRHADGAYSAWRHRTASTWLTAFVAKVFCKANKEVDDAVDKEDIKITIDWLIDHANADGSFDDNMPVLHREMIGQIRESDPTLTAFVLITLQECGISSNTLNSTILRAIKFLENISTRTLKNNPYLLAISTYALALSNSTKKNTFKALLLDIKKDDREGSFWGNPRGKPAHAHSVETTAYALLAMIKLKDFRISSSIVRWLISQRDGQGLFRTTQDAVICLQALSQYRIAAYTVDIDLKVTLLAEDMNKFQLALTNKDDVVHQIIPKLPVERGNNRLLVRVQGTGSAVMTIDLHYNRHATEAETCPFSVTDIDVQEIKDVPIYDQGLANARNCDVCGLCEGGDDNQYNDQAEVAFERRKMVNRRFSSRVTRKCIRFSVSSMNKKKRYGMSVVRFGLETGVEVIKSDLDKLIAGNNTNIARYEMPSDRKGFIMFYLYEITSSETNFIFRLEDSFEGDFNAIQMSSVYIYDYYNQDKHCTQFYSTVPNKVKSFSYQCRKDRRECICIQSTCVQPVEEEIKTLAKRKKNPAVQLHKYACNPDKANYAVVVKIIEVSSNPEAKEINARGVIESSIMKGIENLGEGGEMTFFWKFSCTYPVLEEGKMYLIIGKDGDKFCQDKEEIFRYPLMESALVIENVTPRQVRQNRRKYRLLHMVLNNFKRFMLGAGCLS